MKNKEHEMGKTNVVMDEDNNICESEDVQNPQSVSFLPSESDRFSHDDLYSISLASFYTSSILSQII